MNSIPENSQEIHRRFKTMKIAEQRYNRWKGRDELHTYMEAKDAYHKAQLGIDADNIPRVPDNSIDQDLIINNQGERFYRCYCNTKCKVFASIDNHKIEFIKCDKCKTVMVCKENTVLGNINSMQTLKWLVENKDKLDKQ